MCKILYLAGNVKTFYSIPFGCIRNSDLKTRKKYQVMEVAIYYRPKVLYRCYIKTSTDKTNASIIKIDRFHFPMLRNSMIKDFPCKECNMEFSFVPSLLEMTWNKLWLLLSESQNLTKKGKGGCLTEEMNPVSGYKLGRKSNSKYWLGLKSNKTFVVWHVPCRWCRCAAYMVPFPLPWRKTWFLTKFRRKNT